MTRIDPCCNVIFCSQEGIWTKTKKIKKLLVYYLDIERRSCRVVAINSLPVLVHQKLCKVPLNIISNYTIFSFLQEFVKWSSIFTIYFNLLQDYPAKVRFGNFQNLERFYHNIRLLYDFWWNSFQWPVTKLSVMVFLSFVFLISNLN